MSQGRRSIRGAGVAVQAAPMLLAVLLRVLLGVLLAAVGVVGASPATAATERADTLAKARSDRATTTGQVVRERLHSAKDQDWFRYVFTGSTRAVVTLGSLPADYNLAVYRPDGSRVAVSDHGGKGFERVYFTAAKGTYYVRVASTAGSSSSKYRLWLRALTGKLALQSFTVPAVNSGYPFVVAEFVNTTPDWQRVNQISVLSLAADGRVLQGDALALQQTRVAPYGLLHVASSTVLPLPAGHHHYRVAATASGVPIAAASVSALKLKPGKAVLQDGYLMHTGTVTNTGRTARGGDGDQVGPSVNVTYYNANGTILGSSLTNLVNPVPPGSLVQIAPGATASYRLLARQSYYWYSPFPAANRYTTRLIAAWA